MATERDLYSVLGVGRGATDAEIKRAFRKLAQQTHPDVNSEPGADERFKEINQAYQVLSDPQRRQAYDMFGTTGEGGDQGFGAGGGFGNFGDIFDAFFGGTQAGTRRGHPLAGADLRYDLRITLEEAVHGVDKEIEFTALGRVRDLRGQRRHAGHGGRRPASSAAAAARSGRRAGRCSARWSTSRRARAATARAS